MPTVPVSGASTTPGWQRGWPNKTGVRYTFNCVLWFSNFEHLLAASRPLPEDKCLL